MMDKETIYLLETFAAQMSGGMEGKSGRECAQAQGWLDADGNITPEGRDAAKAFGEQDGTRSAFRIG
ncbi:MAG: hypothetical protein AAFR20_08185 [Pseudomonadota bacterium]